MSSCCFYSAMSHETWAEVQETLQSVGVSFVQKLAFTKLYPTLLEAAMAARL